MRRFVSAVTALVIFVQPLAAQAKAFQANVTAQGGDVAVIASKVNAGQDANLTASNNVALGVAYDGQSATSSSSSKSMLASSSKTSESQKSTAVGSTVTAGRDVNATAQTGNVSVTASTVTAGNAANLSADQGQVQFLAAKDSESTSSTSTSSNPVWWKNQGKGSVDESVKVASLTTGEGGLNVTAKTGVVLEGKAGLKQSIATDPKLAWMAPLANRNDVTFKAVTEAHEKWNYKQQGLSAPAAAVIALAITVATDGAGASLLGGLSGVGGTMANAGFSALVCQAAVGMINHQGDLGAVMKDMGSVESLKNLAATVATAGITAGVMNTDLVKGLTPTGTDTLARLGQQALKQSVNAGASAMTNITINGGKVDESIISSLRMAAIATVGVVATQEIGIAYKQALADGTRDPLEYALQKVAHAAVGCATAKAGGNSCAAGAAGGAVSAVATEALFDPSKKALELSKLVQSGDITQPEMMKQLLEWQQDGADLAKVAGGLAALAAGAQTAGDINAGANAGERVAKHNALETVFDLASLALSLNELRIALKGKDSSKLDVLLAGGSVVIDGAAVALPFIPGGAGVVLTASKQGGKTVIKATTKAGEDVTDALRKSDIADASSLANASRLRSQLVGEEIAAGHAYEKHISEFKNLGIQTKEQFAKHVENVLNTPSSVRYYQDGRTVYLQESTKTVVVRNGINGESTAFVPKDWSNYTATLPSRTTPY